MSKPKNLVICCDGTNNQIAGPPTNVRRLYSMLVRDSEQVTYYDSGVGTTPAADFITDWGRTLGKSLDGAIGLSIRHHMLKAYRWLVTHFEPGDRIWLFGFSRGAYTARALAAALSAFGLLRPELLGLEDLLWENFALKYTKPPASKKSQPNKVDKGRMKDDDADDDAAESEESESMEGGRCRKVSDIKKKPNLFQTAGQFRTSFGRTDDPSWSTGNSHRVRIHFCGVWDTVSAFGTIMDQKTLPFTSHCPSLVHVRHAMALDERRTMFRANLFRFKNGPKFLESLKQVWFPGVHSDVGGGYDVAHSGLAKVALEWMLGEAESLGLRIDPRKREEIMGGSRKHRREHGPAADPCAEIHESLVGLWNMVELLPTRRFAGEGEMGVFPPNLWRPRPVLNFDMTGQKADPVIHQSVLTRMRSCPGYQPRNLPPEGNYAVEPPEVNDKSRGAAPPTALA
jgi:uncharacterized protein (DUF2235 family)